MSGRDAAALFEAERPRLFALAYRMLGSIADAEDVVQETYVRWHAAAGDRIGNPAGWLTTVCARLAVDALRAASRKREHYVGPWLPEPLVTEWSGEVADPAELADTLSLAFMLLLERLSPLERAAFLLRDVFGYDYADIAATLERGEAGCRQLVSRARRRLRQAGAARYTPDPDRAAELLQQFIAAAREGRLRELEALLAADVELWSDSGGEVAAARNVVRGGEPVARLLAGLGRKSVGVEVEPVHVNGGAGLILSRDGRPFAVLSVALDDAGRVAGVYLVLNPRKLERVASSG